MSLRSSSLNRSQLGRLSAGESYEANILPPPLFQSSKTSTTGLIRKKVPGTATMWTVPQEPEKERPTPFREWVATASKHLEREVAAWDAGHELKAFRPKFQSAFNGGRASVASSKKTVRSVLGSVRAAYLGKLANETPDDLISVADSAAVSTISENLRIQQEVARLRTGDDAVKFFAKYGTNSTVKVLYCNRVPAEEEEDETTNRLCNLVIVPGHKTKPEHFTISLSGVLHVCPGEMSECTPLSEWMHHDMLYSVLKSMPFFKLFVCQKNFHHWHENARYEGFCRQRQRLSRSCFLAKPLFVKTLANIHRIASEASELPLFLLSQESQRLSDFVALQLECRSTSSSGTRGQLDRKQDSILEQLSSLISSVQQTCAELPDPDQARYGSKTKSMTKEKQELREQARQRQMAERDFASLARFIRLADYIFQGARAACVIDAAQMLSKRLESGHRMFTVDACFERHGVIIRPTSEEFSHGLSRLWDDARHVVSSVPSFASSNQFKKYFIGATAQEEKTVTEILTSSEAYKAVTGHIEQLVLEQLAVAERGSNEQYMMYHHIYKFGTEWDQDDFCGQSHTIDSLSADVKCMVDFKEELTGFRPRRAFGIVYMNGSVMYNDLEPIPDKALNVMMRLLAQLAHEKCVLTCQQLSVAIKSLDDRPTTLPAVETYKAICDAADNQLTQSEEVSLDLEDTWRLLTKQHFRISVEDQLQLDVLRARHKDLEDVKLPQARAYLANLPPDVFVTIRTSQCDIHEFSSTSSGEAAFQSRSAADEASERDSHSPLRQKQSSGSF